ncbi:Semialdehyde dehydrogenase NAD --binding protein [Deinococcus maricopensis]|uniref:Semialdehyde dehydrogenase NAD-binding protein n=1 Tax=Deinococcus maricopensis (strain DSM 21211 / LMG 22137 / NRRL B-23946 / LB-34) TaxID=709986 RepID=E8U959_DEIML|nr:Semialdehyde dehydrogenase NAD --binding protein [Deinococcus maricopensis]ADV67598.1 Semialdehyde dehydrogenase NAD - binding protein [Deinococcus maricopensis DSM 21211]
MNFRQPVAFLIHPRVNVAADLAQLFHPALARIPNSVYAQALRRLPIPPLVTGHIRYTDAPDTLAAHLITVPLTAAQLLHLPRPKVQAKLEDAVSRARDLGARVVGLGGLNAPATRGGATLTHRTDIGVTNGNAFTAAMTLQGVHQALQYTPDPDRAHIALVGATGSVGACLTRLLARRHRGRLTLIARNPERLHALRDDIAASGADAHASTTMIDARGADLVVLLTSATEALLRSEHLKPHAVVLDDTQPRNTDAALLHTRPDVTIIDGGLVEIPGMRMRGSIGLPRGVAYACLAETLLLGLSGHAGHFSIGASSVDQAEHMLQLARAHADLGFHIAAPHSFSRPLTVTPHARQPVLA